MVLGAHGEWAVELLETVIESIGQVLDWVLKFVPAIWNWVVVQLANVPWSDLASLVWWKKGLLIALGLGIGVLLFRAGREILSAGEQALSSFTNLLTAFIRTAIPILLAGLVAAGGSWVINNVEWNTPIAASSLEGG